MSQDPKTYPCCNAESRRRGMESTMAKLKTKQSELQRRIHELRNEKMVLIAEKRMLRSIIERSIRFARQEDFDD